MYKIASATRADRPVYDLLGPWDVNRCVQKLLVSKMAGCVLFPLPPDFVSLITATRARPSASAIKHAQGFVVCLLLHNTGGR